MSCGIRRRHSGSRLAAGGRTPQCRHYLYAIETLENRLLLTTLTVTTLNDGGPGSLRTIVAQSHGGDVVQFAVTGTITLTFLDALQNHVPISIMHDLTIQGPGVGLLTIDTAQTDPGFLSGGPGMSGATFQDFTIRNQGFGNGGIKNVGGSGLSLTNMTFMGIPGGAIVNSAAGLISVQNCTFTGNGASNGGAIYSPGPLIVTGSTFSNNTSQARGGAIYSTGSLAVSGSAFSGNSSMLGGAIEYGGTNATVTGCTLSSNNAANGGGLHWAAPLA